MRNLDTLLAAKSRLREWLVRSARTLGPASMIALALSAPVWAQDDVTITTPTTLTGDDDLLNARVLTIGNHAALNMELGPNSGLGGSVNSNTLIMGRQDNDSGQLSITGGSVLRVIGDGTVWDPQPIQVPGISIRSGSSYLGLAAGSNSVALVSGAGSSWISGNRLVLGYNGSASVTVENGASLTNGWDSFLGFSHGSSASVSVSGPDSIWNNGRQLTVGLNGTANVVISNGGRVNAVRAFFGGTGFAASGSGEIEITGAGSLFSVTGDLQVGSSTFGQMTISDGGLVQSRDGYVGLFSGGTGGLTVSGPDSRWDMSREFGVGVLSGGTGLAEISNGGRVNSSFGYLGYEAGGRGTVRVSGSGSEWNNSGELWVGNFGEGTLEITGGGKVTAGNEVRLGLQSGSGNVTIDGAGSALTVNNNRALVVGYGANELNGTGSLVISNGGAANSAFGFVGLHKNAEGSVNVAGSDSKWQLGEFLSVGFEGTGNVNLLAGGQITANYVGIGWEATGTGTVNINGAGSRLSSNGAILVGDRGSGSILLTSRGAVTANNDIILGFRNGASGAVTVDGEGSALSTANNLVVGYGVDSGTSNGQMSITRGGTVSNVSGFVGYLQNATGSVLVDGVGSTWNASESILVGSEGTGNLLVSGGGSVVAKYLNVGTIATGTGSLLATGSGTRLQVGDNLSVGYYGTGQVQLAAGATATANLGLIGDFAGSQGVLSITGPGSKLSTAVWTFAGIRGSSDLEITNGGELESYLFMSAAEMGSQSQISVRGANSRLVAWDHYHGNLGNAALSIEDGGEVRANNSMTVGRFAGAQSSVNVSGIGSKLSTTNDLSVGYEGQGSITVENGGLLQFGFLGLGGNASGLGSVHLTGVGSRAEGLPGIFPGLAVGAFGNGELRISNQAELAVGNSYLGLYSGSGNAVVESGGKWTATGDFFVGNEGSGQLEVSSGGKLITNTGAIARLQQSSGSVLVSGAGSEWNHTSSLSVGLDGTGSLTVINGGKVANGAGGYIGFGGLGVGSVSVSNAGSNWSSGAELVVGLFGNGALAIADGGQVLSTNGYVAARGGSGGVVSVLGAGSTWNTGSNLFVGGDDGGRGGQATLVVGSGGLLTGSQTLINYDLVEVGVGGTVDFNHVNNFGTLVNNGMIDASLALHDGSIASGNGMVTGLLSVNDGGILAPGNSVGLMSAGDVAFNGGGGFQLEFLNASGMMGTGWDGLDLSGALTVNATSGNPFLISVSSLAGFSGFSATSNYSWEFITADGGINGFDAGKFTIDASGFAGGAYSDRFWLGSGGNSLRLNFTAVPEPGTLLPLGLVAFGLLARGRKRARVVA